MADNDVHAAYKELLAKGYTAKDAAKEAQARTGFSVVTGKPIKPKGLFFTKQGVTYGQNVQLKKRGKQGIPSQFDL